MGNIPVGRCRNRALEVAMATKADEETNVDHLDEYVVFVRTGVSVVGEYHCTGCGYGVTVRGALPNCPMCSTTTWEQVAWSPFTRAAQVRT
jgi:rubrerythrin